MAARLGEDGNNMGFDFSIANGDFATRTGFYPIDERAGDVFKLTSSGLETKFIPQIGFLTVDLSD